MNLSLGIDLGASAIKFVLINQDNHLLASGYRLSYGRPLAVLADLITSIDSRIDHQAALSLAVSGSASALLPESYFPGINEIAAICSGTTVISPQAGYVIEIGGQSSKFLSGLHSQVRISAGSSCAAGTGSFLEDQMTRLNLDIRDYSACIERAGSIPRIAGRCSVFSKTDIIHRQQQGVPADDILLGLAYAVVRHYKSAVAKNPLIDAPAVLIGGTGFNRGIVRAVREIFHLDEQNLLLPPECGIIQALGTAVLARSQGTATSLAELTERLRTVAAVPPLILPSSGLPPLPEESPLQMPVPVIPADPNLPLECVLGIDVGSTSTNLVLLESDSGKMIDSQYLRTGADPLKTVRNGLISIKERLGSIIEIGAVGTTGSGREYIGRRIGADCMPDEITAQATAVLHLVPDADTVFEIGGQDSKYINLRNGRIENFEMNKICAAGTGAFIEEQAARMGLSLTEFYTLARQSKTPADLGEHCTVFMESAISRLIAAGQAAGDIAAGLCHAIVRNYLTRVVGSRPVGEKIVFSGGLAFNPAIVGAFRSRFGKRLVIPEYFAVNGAVGAALLANSAAKGKKTLFHGYPDDQAGFSSVPDTAVKTTACSQTALQKKMEEFLLEGYTGERDPRKKTVGIPRSLTIYRMFPLFCQFFTQLGYNVLLSSGSSDETIRRSQEYAREETCYPVKLMHGHMAELAEQQVDYIFMPRIHTMKHEISKTRRNFGCVYMQTAPVIAAGAVGLEKQGIKLLSPVLNMELGKTAMASALTRTGTGLGHSEAACLIAAAKGAAAFMAYGKKSELLGEQLLKTIAAGETGFVIMTRPYGVNDPCLNMNIESIIEKLGYRVLHLDHLPGHDIDTSGEYPNLYWPFGQHILSGAELVRRHPNLYAVYLTNHGCGPDTMLAHFFREQMEDKPYLAIEVDEHASAIGISTRIEAFVTSIKTHTETAAGPVSFASCAARIPHRPTKVSSSAEDLNKDLPVCLPDLYPYTPLLAAALCRCGYQASVLDPGSAEALKKGRETAQSKEYFTFTSLAGDILHAAPDRGACQYLIWQTEGAEADGQYPYVIQSHLNRLRLGKARLIAPFLESLPQQPFGEQFFLTVSAGDLLMMADEDQQGLLLERLCKKLRNQPLSISDLQSMSRQIPAVPDRPDLVLCGDPAVLYHPMLRKELETLTGEISLCIRYSPLSEYLLFLWQDALGEDAVLPYTELAAQTGISPDFAQLRELADRHLPSYNGGNGRYRYARMMSGSSRGILHFASQYENTGTILELLPHNASCRQLSIGFDGAFSQSDKLKLESFLYYL